MPKAFTKKKRLKDLPTPENHPYLLPSGNDDLKAFCRKNKIDMTEQVVASIEFAIKHQLPIVEVFQFTGSSFVLTISDREFETNLKHIYELYLKTEHYELCDRVVRLRNLIKENTDEKEKTSTTGSLEHLFKQIGNIA